MILVVECPMNTKMCMFEDIHVRKLDGIIRFYILVSRLAKNLEKVLNKRVLHFKFMTFHYCYDI